MKLKETQLFYLIIKLTKPYAVPTACKSSKTKRGISIIFSRADNYAVAMAVALLKLRAAIVRVSWHFLKE